MFLSDIREEEIWKRASFSLNFVEAYFYWSILFHYLRSSQIQNAFPQHFILWVKCQSKYCRTKWVLQQKFRFHLALVRLNLCLTIVATHFRQELISKIICKYPLNSYLKNGSSEILSRPWRRHSKEFIHSYYWRIGVCSFMWKGFLPCDFKYFNH